MGGWLKNRIMELKKGMFVVITPLSNGFKFDKTVVHLIDYKTVTTIQFLTDGKECDVREANNEEKDFCRWSNKNFNYEKTAAKYVEIDEYRAFKKELIN